MNASPLGFAMQTSTAVREIDVSRKVRSSKCLSKLQIIYEFKHQSNPNTTLSNQSKDCVTELSTSECRNVKCNKGEALTFGYTSFVTKDYAETFKRSKILVHKKCSKLKMYELCKDKCSLKKNLRQCQI